MLFLQLHIRLSNYTCDFNLPCTYFGTVATLFAMAMWYTGIPLLFRIPKAWLRALQCGDWSSQRLLVHCLDCDPARICWLNPRVFAEYCSTLCKFPGTRCFTSRVGCAGTYFPCKHQFHGSGKEANR